MIATAAISNPIKQDAMWRRFPFGPAAKMDEQYGQMYFLGFHIVQLLQYE